MHVEVGVALVELLEEIEELAEVLCELGEDSRVFGRCFEHADRLARFLLVLEQICVVVHHFKLVWHG